MTDTKSQLESMITYLLGVMWEQGEALRKTTPKDSLRYAKTIRMLALAINQLQWIAYDESKPEPKAEPDAPQTEPAEWDKEQETEPEEELEGDPEPV